MADIKKDATTTAVATQEKKQITDIVLDRITQFKETGTLKFPKDYSPENALKASYLLLLETKTRDNKPVLEACTKESIANALLKMVVLGLNPIKKQGNFIAYGDKLSFDVEYAGNIALAKRCGMKGIKGVAINKGDEFEFEINPTSGRKCVTKHKQTIDSIGDPNIVGAYAVIEYEDGTVDTEIMNFKQIQAAWNQGSMKGNSPAHKNFPDQMAIKTVINRACKLIIRTSDDSSLYGDDGGETSQDAVKEDVKSTFNTQANRKIVDFAEVEEAQEVQAVQTVKENESNQLSEEEKAEIEREEAEHEIKEQSADLFAGSGNVKKTPGF